MQCLFCGDWIHPHRSDLGYKTCLLCGEEQAKQERLGWCVAPLNKSNYTLITDTTLLKQLNPKRTI